MTTTPTQHGPSGPYLEQVRVLIWRVISTIPGLTGVGVPTLTFQVTIPCAFEPGRSITSWWGSFIQVRWVGSGLSRPSRKPSPTGGPVLGSLIVAVVGSATSPAVVHDPRFWTHEYRICGIARLVVFLIALVGLRELAPQLRDQLMVTMRDRALIEARAKGIDIEAALRRPFRQLLKPDVVVSAIAVPVMLLFRVRKPFMVIGGVVAAVMVVVYLEQAGSHPSYYTLAVILAVLSFCTGIAYTPRMAVPPGAVRQAGHLP